MAGGGGNLAFFAGSSSGINIRFWNNNALVFIGDGVRGEGLTIDIAHNSVCYIDKNSTFGPVNFNSAEGRSIIIGRDCMFSWNIEMWNFDGHAIYDKTTNARISRARSIYIGDHVWFGRNAGGFKGFFVASGSIIGTKSMVVGDKIFFSNTANGGYPCKQIRDNIFWIREGTGVWDSKKEMEYGKFYDDSFKYAFEADKFLNPALIECELNALNQPLEKLQFLYNTLYCNVHKNRFALFSDSNYKDSKLYCAENAFAKINFESPTLMRY